MVCFRSVCVCVCVCVCVKSLQSCPTLCEPSDYPARLLCPWDFPGKNTGVGSHSLLQGIFQTQGSNLHLMSLELAGEFFTNRASWEALRRGWEISNYLN